MWHVTVVLPRRCDGRWGWCFERLHCLLRAPSPLSDRSRLIFPQQLFHWATSDPRHVWFRARRESYSSLRETTIHLSHETPAPQVLESWEGLTHSRNREAAPDSCASHNLQFHLFLCYGARFQSRRFWIRWTNTALNNTAATTAPSTTTTSITQEFALVVSPLVR